MKFKNFDLDNVVFECVEPGDGKKVVKFFEFMVLMFILQQMKRLRKLTISKKRRKKKKQKDFVSRLKDLLLKLKNWRNKI
jgi:hypothetical protein